MPDGRKIRYRRPGPQHERPKLVELDPESFDFNELGSAEAGHTAGKAMELLAEALAHMNPPKGQSPDRQAAVDALNRAAAELKQAATLVAQGDGRQASPFKERPR